MMLCSAGLKVLRERFLYQETKIISLDWKLRLLLDHFGFLMLLNEQVKNGVMALTRMTDPDP